MQQQQRVEQLLRQNADPNAPHRPSGNTALLCAGYDGQLQLVEALLNARALLEASNHQSITALIYAARKQHTEVVEALVEARAQPDARDDYGNTALYYTAKQGNAEATEALVKAGAVSWVSAQETGSYHFASVRDCFGSG